MKIGTQAPTAGGQWTAEDLPYQLPMPGNEGGYLLHSPMREVLAEWLNAHYPKPQPYDQGGVRGADSLLYRAERERDAAVARAEQLEKKLAKVMSDYQDVEDERDEWKARAEAAEDYAQAVSDSNRDNAHHPKPAANAAEWLDRALNNPDERLVALDEARIEANIQRNRALRERDAAIDRAEQAEAGVRLANQQSVEWETEAERLLCECDEWKARAEAAEARTAPAVTREDVRGVIDHWIVQGGNHEALLDDLWRWVSGDDPAVHVVRESEVDAVEVERDGDGHWRADGDYLALAGSVLAVKPRECADKTGRDLIREIALARAIEAEAAVDPVEAKARVEADRRYSGEPNHAFIEGAVWAARHVLGQEVQR